MRLLQLDAVNERQAECNKREHVYGKRGSSLDGPTVDASVGEEHRLDVLAASDDASDSPSPLTTASRTPDLEALVRGMYVRGLSTQDVGALYRDFGETRLSKSTVSRITQQLNQDFETWRRRDLSDLPIVYLFLDRQYHAARQGTDEKDCVLSACALLEDGRPVLLHLDMGPRNRMTPGSVFCRTWSRAACAIRCWW